jgi:hypothetical protein
MLKNSWSFSEGKIVITADHGELLGDRVGTLPIKTYGHVAGLYADGLVQVPWLIHQSDERSDITEDTPVGEVNSTYNDENKTVGERLRDLGYKI